MPPPSTWVITDSWVRRGSVAGIPGTANTMCTWGSSCAVTGRTLAV